jgi:putative CocE/NonD family hydrolase
MGRLLVPVLAGLLLLVLPGAASAAEFTKKSLAFNVTVGPNDDQPCRVVADLYTPTGASSSDRVPALMGTNGFGGSKEDFGKLGPAFASRGYAFLAYSGLGFGNSGCKITLDDPDYDGRAGVELVDFLGGSKAAEDGTKIDYIVKDGPNDPRVGMIGGSYGGQIQFAIAGLDRRMDAIVPQITWFDLSYSLAPNNTDFVKGVTYDTPGVAKLDWPVLFTALGISTGFQQAIQNQDPSHLGACPNFTDQVCRSLVTTALLGYPQPDTLELLRHASVTSYIERIKIPTFVIQGQSDTLFNLNEAVATYRGLFGQGTPVKMLWRSAGHSGGGLGTRENDSTNLERAYETRMALEWFDFYLRGLGDAPTLDFSFLRDWALGEGTGDAAPAVGSTPTYPASTDQQMFLSGSNELTGSREAVKAGTAQFAALTGSPTGRGNGFSTATGTQDLPGTFATFNGPPLTEDLDVVGIPKLTVKLSAPVHAGTQGANPGGKLVLFAKLLDVGPNGATPVLPRDQLSPVRVADVTKPVTIDLPGISYRFKKGHQLRLIVSTSNAVNRTNNVAGPVSITSDPASPNVLTVPKLGAQTGAEGSGPSGTTPFAAAEGAPAPQRPGSGFVAPRGAGSAAALPSSRRCASRRRFTIRLRKAPKGDRHRSAVVTVNGRRARVLRPSRRTKRLRASVVLTGLPKGTFRVHVTIRTVKGRTLRAARTYRTCVPKRR